MERVQPSAPPAAAPSLPVAVHPLVWAIQLWVVATVTSLLLSPGLSRALRGAYVGAGSMILLIDDVGARTSQVAAICTTLLLIYAAVVSARAAKSLVIGFGAALLGAVPALVVFYAHRYTMPQLYTWMSALCGAGALVLCAIQARSNNWVRAITLLSGLALASAALRTLEFSESSRPVFVEVGALLQAFFSWCAVIAALILHLSFPKAKALRGALLFGATVLLAATAAGSTEPAAARWVLLTGRTLHELTSAGVMGTTGPLALSCALLLVFSALLSRPSSLAQVICAILALCVVAPFSPLSIATMTLCGYCAVIICWVPEARLQSSSDTAHI